MYSDSPTFITNEPLKKNTIWDQQETVNSALDVISKTAQELELRLNNCVLISDREDEAALAMFDEDPGASSIRNALRLTTDRINFVNRKLESIISRLDI